MDEEKQERGERKKGRMNKRKGKSIAIHSPHRP